MHTDLIDGIVYLLYTRTAALIGWCMLSRMPVLQIQRRLLYNTSMAVGVISWMWLYWPCDRYRASRLIWFRVPVVCRQARLSPTPQPSSCTYLKKKKKSLRMVLHAWYFTERNRFCFRYRVLVCTVCWEEPSCFGIRRKLWLLTWRWHPNSLLTSILNISPVHSKYWPSPICVYVRARVCVRERVCSIAVFPCVTARTWVFISVVVFAVSFVFVGLEHFLSIIAHMPCHLWYVRVQWLCGCCYWVFWVSRWILDGEGWWVLNGIAAANVIKTLLWLCLRGEDKTSPSSSGFYHTLSVSRFLAPGL